MKSKCENCGLEYRAKRLRKRKEKLLCHTCWRRTTKILPSFDPQRSIKTMEKNDKIKEKRLERKREKRLENNRQRETFPKIRGAKRRINNLYITTEEKRVLHQKYKLNGLDSEKASEKVNQMCKYMSDLVSKLRKENIEENEISKRFKEEWAKLIDSRV